MLSSSGPTAGTSFVAPLSMPGVHYTDRQWAAAVRWRLGIRNCGPAAVCKNLTLKQESCAEELDPDGDHAVMCGTGPLRNLRHDCLADIYAGIFDEIGAVARREVYVPELSRAKEAWLDVWGFGVPELPDALLDITVRHPRSSRYMPSAARAYGHAADEAHEKAKKYLSANGRRGIAVAHETWGRLGSSAEHLLSACAGVASRRAHRRGRLPGGCLNRWRAQLDAALHRNVAAQLSAAWHGLPGKRPLSLPPSSRAELEARCPL